MEIKRPFTDEDFQATPEPVQRYIIQLEEVVVKLLMETEDLEKRITEPENKLNKNSRNSGKPPSSDPLFKKPDRKTKKGPGKRGGQKGHKGHQQKLMPPTSENIILPGECVCGCSDVIPDSLKAFHTHQVIELPEIKMDVLHFILHKGVCSKCGKVVKAEIPSEHQTGYGPSLSALIAEISGIQGNSRETVRTFCRSVLNFPISTGAIQKVIDRASGALKPVYSRIASMARSGEVNYIDETSWFQSGALNRLRVMANNPVAYFMIHKNRSKEAFQTLVQEREGIPVSDNYGVYAKWINLRQTCLAHIIRKAKALAERKDENVSQFGKQVVQDLQLLCRWAKSPPDNEEWRSFYNRFTELIFQHQKDRNEIATMARSLIRQPESLWLFPDIAEAEPTGNHAERTLRYGVLWRKRSKGTQSEKGNHRVKRILSFRQTCFIRSLESFPVMADLIHSYFKEQEPDLAWL